METPDEVILIPTPVTANRASDGVTLIPTPATADRAYQAYIMCRLSTNNHPEMDNTDHCEACRKQGNILLHSTNFKQPCRCCGSQDHGLLTYIQEIEKEKIHNVAQVTCPSVWTTCISKILQEDRMRMINQQHFDRLKKIENQT